jgi:hypothetical protein
MGSNAEGRLGIDDPAVNFSSSPCLVPRLTELFPSKIACGWGHTAVVTSNGEVFTWGVGEFGALGSGSTSTSWAPSRALLPEGLHAQQVSCGSRHSAILMKNGNLALAGCGKAGQLGTRKREQENFFVVVDLKAVVQVACGVFHTAVLNSKGQVLTTGGNSFGQLGLGNKKSTSTFEVVKGLEGVFVSKVACGYHSAAVCEKGEVYIWGTGSFGEYLIPHKMYFPARVKDVSVGGTFAVASLQDQSIFVWGNNTNGELGLGDFQARPSPTPIPVLKGKKINAVACGGTFCMALGNDVVGRPKSVKKESRHVRSQSKVEKSYDQLFNQKNFEVLKLEERVNDEKIKNERLRINLDETASNNFRLKHKSTSLENGIKQVEVENSRLREENSSLINRVQDLQRQHKEETSHLLTRVQELQKQNDHAFVFRAQESKLKEENSILTAKVQDLQVQLVEIQSLKEENLSLQRRLSELKHLREELNSTNSRFQETQVQLKDQQKETFRAREEIQQLSFKLLESQSQVSDFHEIRDENLRLKRKIEDFEKFYKDFESTKKDLHDERLKNKSIEKNFFVLTEENSKLLKQSENLFNELTRIQKESENSLFLEKENHFAAIRVKEIEIEKISASYHDLLVQVNRLAEENRIFRVNNLELEEKNKKLFENLEKELAARAHDYKERTLNILAAERENRKSVSPLRNNSGSPKRRVEGISRTKLSEVTQAKIGNTAARLLAKMENESALANIRISSPSRKSPDRPVPYKQGVSKEIREIFRAKLQEYRD